MGQFTDRTANNQLASARVASNVDIANPTLLANQCDQRSEQFQTFLAAGTAATTYNFPLMRADRILQPIEVRILPTAALVANATNFDTWTVYYNNDAGGANTNFATGNSSATSWSAGQSVLVPLIVPTPNIPAGSMVGVSFVPTGTGVSIPANTSIQMIYQEV